MTVSHDVRHSGGATVLGSGTYGADEPSGHGADRSVGNIGGRQAPSSQNC
jgi:hypothetical protein